MHIDFFFCNDSNKRGQHGHSWPVNSPYTCMKLNVWHFKHGFCFFFSVSHILFLCNLCHSQSLHQLLGARLGAICVGWSIFRGQDTIKKKKGVSGVAVCNVWCWKRMLWNLYWLQVSCFCFTARGLHRPATQKRNHLTAACHMNSGPEWLVAEVCPHSDSLISPGMWTLHIWTDTIPLAPSSTLNLSGKSV